MSYFCIIQDKGTVYYKSLSRKASNFYAINDAFTSGCQWYSKKYRLNMSQQLHKSSWAPKCFLPKYSSYNTLVRKEATILWTLAAS